MFIHLDYKGFDKNINMFDGHNLALLYHWIRFGGKFILHGEGEYVSWLLQVLTNKPWHFCGDFYRRFKHHCNRKHFHHFPLQEAVVETTTANGTTTVATTTTSSNINTNDSDSDSGDETANQNNNNGSNSNWLLPKHINMKATTLCGVAKEDRLYNPKPGARCISSIPGFGGHVVNSDRTGIAFTPKEKGFVCHVGDVNAEIGTMQTLITILRLPMNI